MAVNEQEKTVIIVAGGAGTRMGTEVPKQFLLLKGKPILMHTIEVFHKYSEDLQIIVVLPSDQIYEWEMLKLKYDFTIVHQVAVGGSERFYSVQNGLKLVKVGRLVGVHDGVRPLVSHRTIEECFGMATKHKSAVPVVDMVESLRQISAQGSVSVPRHLYKLVQTPQVFSYDVIMGSYELPFCADFTDDASVVEAAGFEIYLTEGNRENIKVTTPIDLLLAQVLMGQ